MGIVGLIGGKKGKLCVRFIVAAAILAAVVLAYAAFASALTATLVIVNSSGATVNDFFISRSSEVL